MLGRPQNWIKANLLCTPAWLAWRWVVLQWQKLELRTSTTFRKDKKMYNSSYTKQWNVSGPTLVTSLNWTPIVEEYVLRVWITKKQSCLKQIGLHAQNQSSILASRINIIGGIYITIQGTKKKSSLWYWIEYSYELQNHEENGYSLHLNWISSETNQVFDILKAVDQSETATI